MSESLSAYVNMYICMYILAIYVDCYWLVYPIGINMFPIGYSLFPIGEAGPGAGPGLGPADRA